MSTSSFPGTFPGTFTGATGSTNPNHPTLDWAVTPEQRARAEDYLQRAYTNGRLTHDEFDRRIGLAIGATTRRELNQAFEGLASIPTEFPGGVRASSPYVGTSMSTYYAGPLSRPRNATGLGAAAQLSVLPTWLVGPGLVAMCTPSGTPAHREAAKAFNSTLSFTVLAALLSMAASFIHPVNSILGLVGVLWVVFAIVGAVKASRGDEWNNPFSRVLPLRILSEK